MRISTDVWRGKQKKDKWTKKCSPFLRKSNSTVSKKTLTHVSDKSNEKGPTNLSYFCNTLYMFGEEGVGNDRKIERIGR